ncbi:hypothetical protein FJY94_02500 [Candidatus Kaiserbacteria bacterium]|nr:hypothetical protein [Candidatus Kaiserbacteria bacterium]
MKKGPELVLASNRHGIDWQRSRSKDGHVIAEVLSAVIKEIRRGKEEEALYWALEMAACGPVAEQFLWECLVVFTAEDVGLADTAAVVLVTQAKTGCCELPTKDKRRGVFIALAVSYLCRCQKSRYVTELLEDVKGRKERGEFACEMPDYAIDMHTERGRARGRGLAHYLREGAHLEHTCPHLPETYHSRLMSLVEAEEEAE